MAELWLGVRAKLHLSVLLSCESAMLNNYYQYD